MAKFSALITCTTECEVTITAATAEEARSKIALGEFDRARLHDGGLAMSERFSDISITDESFGEDV